VRRYLIRRGVSGEGLAARGYGASQPVADNKTAEGRRKNRRIASWAPEDVERVAQELDSFPDRIRRDRWVSRARKQHELKYGERL